MFKCDFCSERTDNMFDKSKWIWINGENNPDEYADFLIDFKLSKAEGTKLNISVDGNFEAYLNGKLCALGSCSDYPDEKFYDSFDLDDLCIIGENQLKITVWHIGISSSVYYPAAPGLLFSVTQGESTVAYSCESTLSRKNTNYSNGLCKIITGQLGPSYRYDNTVVNKEPYVNSVEVEKTNNIVSRGIKNLELWERISFGIEDDGHRLLIDFDMEVAGYLDLEFDSEGEQELLVVFGEHLDENGRVPRIIGPRDFSIGFVAKDGENRFLGGMRRIAGRYIEIEYTKPIKVGYIGIRPIVYPLNIKEKSFENQLHKRIYDVSVYTLICCMHEHYEDCPWREQALYSLDSRNQMLCGYIAFEEYIYARYNIILLAKSLNNGILRITSPTDKELPIPFFSLTFIQQVAEYVRFSGDRSILDEVMHVVEAIVETFASRIDDSGLLPVFPAPAWNFYEWSAGNDGYGASGTIPKDRPKYDLCLNAMFLYVFGMYKEIGGKIEVDREKMASGIKRVLFDEENGLYKTSSEDGRFSMVGNSLAILAGLGGSEIADKLISERDQLVGITLSMNAYFYDALLSVDKSYKDYIIKDIEEKYGYMLSCGATTFWETIDGWRAFSDAGSLCHGWSALPAYYLTTLLK